MAFVVGNAHKYITKSFREIQVYKNRNQLEVFINIQNEIIEPGR